MSEPCFVSELFRFYPPLKALSIIGYVSLVGLDGMETGAAHRSLVGRVPLARATLYRYARDLTSFRRFMGAKLGRDVSSMELLAAFLLDPAAVREEIAGEV